MSWLRSELAQAAAPFCFAIIASATAAAVLMFLAFILIPPLAIFIGVIAFLSATPIAAAHVLLLGLPIYLAIRLTGGEVRWWNAIGVGVCLGFVAGALGWTGIIGWVTGNGHVGPAGAIAWDLARISLFAAAGGIGGFQFARKFPASEPA